MVMPYHLHMPSYFLETFTEYPYKKNRHPFFSVMPVFLFIKQTYELPIKTKFR
mgnify:CR=1 FL=1